MKSEDLSPQARGAIVEGTVTEMQEKFRAIEHLTLEGEVEIDVPCAIKVLGLAGDLTALGTDILEALYDDTKEPDEDG